VDLDRDNDEKMDKYVKDAPQPIDDQSTHVTLANDEQRSQHIRKRLAWMSNYEKTRIDQSNDPLTHFMLFLYRDPMTFKDVVRESKWWKTMDDEIDFIKRNNVEFTKLKRYKKP